MNDYLDYLEHHGIKGQKWGVRKTNRYTRKAARALRRNNIGVEDRRDYAVYGKRGLRKIDKSVNNGLTREDARQKLVKKRMSTAAVVGLASTAAGAAITAGIMRRGGFSGSEIKRTVSDSVIQSAATVAATSLASIGALAVKAHVVDKRKR